MNKKIVITGGDPAGCGPRLVWQSLQSVSRRGVDYVIVGDKKIFDKVFSGKKNFQNVEFVDCRTPGISSLTRGKATFLSGKASLSYIDTALKLIAEEKIPALVTAPVSKEAVGRIYAGFSGHTEYLADFFKIKKFCMMMDSPAIRTVLLTRHIPLKKVPKALSEKIIIDTAELVYSFLSRRAAVRQPRIALASVNPHAGRDTFLGEEEKIMVRAIKKSRKKIYGPFPSDTLFAPLRSKQFDCILCAYHDQGMIPFKLLSFSRGVNVTIGLPIVRTSPAHGTAYDAVRKKMPLFSTSMEAALRSARRYAYETE